MFVLNYEARAELGNKTHCRANSGRKESAAVHHGRIGIDELNGCRQEVVALANCILRVPLCAPQQPLSLAFDINAARFTKAKFVKRGTEVRFRQALTYFAEVVV